MWGRGAGGPDPVEPTGVGDTFRVRSEDRPNRTGKSKGSFPRWTAEGEYSHEGEGGEESSPSDPRTMVKSWT